MNAIYALVLRSHGNESHRNCRDNKKTINCVLISQSKDQFKCVSVRGCGWECWVHRLQCIPGASLSWNLFFPVETWMWSGQLSWKESFSSNLQSKDGKRQSRHAFAFALHLVQYSPHRSKNNLIVWKTLRMEHSTIYTMDVGRYPSIPMHYAKYHIRVKYCTCEWKKKILFRYLGRQFHYNFSSVLILQIISFSWKAQTSAHAACTFRRRNLSAWKQRREVKYG